MPGTWQIEELKVGAVMEAGARRRSSPATTHAFGPACRCLVRIASVTKPDRDDRGTIELEFVRAEDFKLEGAKHPLFEGDQRRMLPEVLKSSFCGRFNGRWDDVNGDAGAVWSVLSRALREAGAPTSPS